MISIQLKNMKKILLFLLSMTVSSALYSQNLVETSAKVTRATIYINQAQVENTVQANLPAGHSKILVENIANTLDANSIQVGGTGDFTLLGVSYNANYLKPVTLSMDDDLDKVKATIENLQMQLEVVGLERQMLMANANVKGESKLTTVELNEMAATFRKNLTDIGNRELKLKREIAESEKEKERIEKQIQSNRQSRQPEGIIELTVLANSATVASLEIIYLARNAGWSPSYDLRVEDVQSEVNIIQKANVFQNTGIHWDNVQLSLSTTNPLISTTKPELHPQYLNMSRPVPQAEAVEYARMETPRAMLKADANMGSSASVVNVVNSTLSVEFEIDMPVTVKSGGVAEVVEIQHLSAPAKYKTYIVPKLDKNGYLIAEVEDWESFNLIGGQASIYFENKYVGKTYISEQNTEDVLKLSLGRDTRITSERKPIENFKSKRMLGSTERMDIGYRITIRNLKNEAIDLIVEDQIPISQDSKIEVSLIGADGGEIDKEEGKVKWNIKLGSSDNKSLNLKYQVKYPKGTRLYNL